jgi:hypothetical protein
VQDLQLLHELGHFFIDSHRSKLEKGISLSYNSHLVYQPDSVREEQANHFASNLLMPKSLFVSAAKKYDIGIEAILGLKKRFDTSIECTAIHYVKLDLSPCIMIKWKANCTFSYAFYSKSFSQIIGIKGRPAINFNHKYIFNQSHLIENSKVDFVETATSISKWISTVNPGGPKDILGLEQTIKLGDFGGITLLTFS